MAKSANIMAEILKLDGYVTKDHKDIFATTVQSHSPSLNYIFDNTWGLPLGYSGLLGGAPKGGKTLITNSFIGTLHQADPEAYVLKYNTEFRERAQMTPQQKMVWGIDDDRYIVFETNVPNQIFDNIELLIPKMYEAGMPVKLLVIDSLTDILGRQEMKSESVDKNTIGDRAKTLNVGFARIRALLAKYEVATILTCQIRAEMDQYEQTLGNKTKFASGGFKMEHMCEYFIEVTPMRSKAGKVDLLGNELRDHSVKVAVTDSAQTKDGDFSGHKVKVKMKNSSLGRSGREGLFTLDHDRGIINTHEEVFILGKGFGIIGQPNKQSYTITSHPVLHESLKGYLEHAWRGKETFLDTLKNNSELCSGIIKTCKLIDINRKNGVVFENVEHNSEVDITDTIVDNDQGE
jgi:RecA/RadA recombinase